MPKLNFQLWGENKLHLNKNTFFIPSELDFITCNFLFLSHTFERSQNYEGKKAELRDVNLQLKVKKKMMCVIKGHNLHCFIIFFHSGGYVFHRN